MKRQCFRGFRIIAPERSRMVMQLVFSALAVLFWTTACDELPGEGSGDPTLETSSACDPPCTGQNMGCFKDPEPVCIEVTCPPSAPVYACAIGASCVEDANGSGQCVFESACSPSCSGNQHCTAGNCIPNYTSTNVCDPLEYCRNQCGSDGVCLNACEHDRSPTCVAQIKKLRECEQREGCPAASPTGCCADVYRQTFPSSGTPCKSCWNSCRDKADPIACLSSCAETSASCQTCLSDFSTTCNNTDTPACQQKFNACVGD